MCENNVNVHLENHGFYSIAVSVLGLCDISHQLAFISSLAKTNHSKTSWVNFLYLCLIQTPILTV